MPLYVYHCPRCQWERSDIRTIDERHDGPACDRCWTKMQLRLSPVVGIVKNPAVPRTKK